MAVEMESTTYKPRSLIKVDSSEETIRRGISILLVETVPVAPRVSNCDYIISEVRWYTGPHLRI